MIADPTNAQAGESGLKAPPRGTVTIVVCDTCRRPGDLGYETRAGELLAAATEAAAADSAIRVRRVSCLGNCKRGSSAAIVRNGGWSYVFGDLDAATSGPDLVVGAELFATSQDGLMPWRGRPDSLKYGMIARIPPLGIIEELP